MITVNLTREQVTDMLEVMNEARHAADDAQQYELAAGRRAIVNKLCRAEEYDLRTRRGLATH